MGFRGFQLLSRVAHRRHWLRSGWPDRGCFGAAIWRDEDDCARQNDIELAFPHRLSSESVYPVTKTAAAVNLATKVFLRRSDPKTCLNQSHHKFEE